MGQSTTIEWAEATWNPVTGCTKVSRGCDNCYAHTLAHGRLHDVYTRQLPVVNTSENRRDPFAVRTWPGRLNHPEKWGKGRVIFVNSMSDLFHIDVPDEFVKRIFDVMLSVDRHVYQVLTKRPSRAARWIRRHANIFKDGVVPEHIWIGTSIEDQEVIHRLHHLRDVPAAVRFLSCEPLLGPLELNLQGIDWVIAGGESGIGYRAMDAGWARGIRDQCLEQRVPFFFKQWGGRTPKAGGRELDGRTWDELPAYGQAALTSAK